MTRSRARRRASLAVLALLALVAVWHFRTAGQSVATRPLLPTTIVTASAGDRLIVEPDAGITVIDNLLGSAKRSLDLCIYELRDPTAEQVIAGDAQRGVKVRVILDRRLEGSRNAAAALFLRARGVDVHWASPRFFVSHEKAFVIDDKTAVVMTLNLDSDDYATTRDAAVVDPDQADVRAIEDVFDADFADRSIHAPPGDDLVWSPDRSQADVLSLITHARRSILLESEELSAPSVVSALVDAARRGVAVGVVMTDDVSWHAAWNSIVKAGGRVSVLHGETPLYIHAKLLVIDAGSPDARALVGSQNLSTTSLDSDRELGVVLTQPRLVQAVGRVVESDAELGTSWTMGAH